MRVICKFCVWNREFGIVHAFRGGSSIRIRKQHYKRPDQADRAHNRICHDSPGRRVDAPWPTASLFDPSPKQYAQVKHKQGMKDRTLGSRTACDTRDRAGRNCQSELDTLIGQ